MKLLTLLLIFLFSLLLFSCKKTLLPQTPETGSLIVFNGIVNGSSAYNSRSNALTFNEVAGQNNGNGALNNSGVSYPLLSGTYDLYFRAFSDPIHPYYVQNGFTIGAKEIYSLYLCGTTTSPEGVMTRENFTPIKDSILALRFVNLCPNSTPLIVTLSTSTSTNEFSNLAYKQVADFRMYPSLYNSSYTWQVRAANNPSVVLTTFTLATSSAFMPRFGYVTLVIRGLLGSSPAPGISVIYHTRTI